MQILSSNRVAIADLLKKELDTEVVAMLQEALNEGYSFADVMSVLDEQGYKVAIVPAMTEAPEAPEAPDLPTEAPETEVEDSWVSRFSAALRERLGLDKAAEMPTTFDPPQGVQEAAKRAQGWVAEGYAGDGFTAVGRARMGQLAGGRGVSLATIKKMYAYFSRHGVNRAEHWDLKDGKPSAWRVAWDAWGGDAGRTWTESLYGRYDLKKEYEPVLTPRQEVMYEAYEQIAEMFGAWNGSTGADGAHYIPAADNIFAEKGMACKNCVFYEGGGGCEILDMPVEPEAACKLWIIPESLMTPEAQKAEKAHGAHSFEESDGGNCSVCAQKKDNWRHMVKAEGAHAVISKAVDEKRFTLAPMYVPDTLDAHGEWTDADELQNAVWEYVRSGDRRIRLQHQRDIVAGEWVEVMQIPYPMNVPMYKGDGTIEERTYPAGTVFLGVIWEEWAWDAVKSGALSGYSIGGRTERVIEEMPA